MKLILLLCVVGLCVIVSSQQLSDTRNDRIVGGTSATLNQFPYQVALNLYLPRNQQSFCGGSIIAQNFILSAAHCMLDALSVDVRAGILNILTGVPEYRSTVQRRDWLIHEQYNPTTLLHDIAIIRLRSAIRYTNSVQAIALPQRVFENSQFLGFLSTASGWGRFSDVETSMSSTLQFVQLPIISNHECQRVYGHFVTPTQICTSGLNQQRQAVSTCQGDSGGPLTVRFNNIHMLVGVVSFGAGLCEIGHPQAYTRVSSYISWISRNTGLTLQ